MDRSNRGAGLQGLFWTVACLHLWIGTLNGLWIDEYGDGIGNRMRWCVRVRERRVETFAMAGQMVNKKIGCWFLGKPHGNAQAFPLVACPLLFPLPFWFFFLSRIIRSSVATAGGSYRIEFCGKKWASTSMILVAAALLLSKVDCTNYVQRMCGKSVDLCHDSGGTVYKLSGLYGFVELPFDSVVQLSCAQHRFRLGVTRLTRC
ncbi:hypothetical protein AKJ16_DCAP06605 [Drosera capensis]